MRTIISFCRLLFFVLIFNVSGLYGQGVRYDWNNYNIGTAHAWDTLSNWRVGGVTPSQLPGPMDSVYFSDTTSQALNIIALSHVDIAYFKIASTTSINPFVFDSISVVKVESL